jgi:hypothetical protein
MKYWPVPNSYSKEIPANGSPGAFWEDRDDRYHCGVDIYAPEGSKVVAIDSGIIVDIGTFTSPDCQSYWNETYYLIIKTNEKILYKYAELGDIAVNLGDYVEAGQKIGKVGKVFNEDMLPLDTPFYVRELILKGNPSMLHLELYKAPIMEVKPYSGGNFFGRNKPDSLIDPTFFLNGKIKRELRGVEVTN